VVDLDELEVALQGVARASAWALESKRASEREGERTDLTSLAVRAWSRRKWKMSNGEASLALGNGNGLPSATAARAAAVVEKGRSAEVEVDEAAEVGGGKRDEGVAGRAEVASGRCGGVRCGCAAARRPGAGGRAAMTADVEDLNGDEARWTVGDGLGAARGACRCRLQAQQRRELGIALNESCRERGRRGREPPSASADGELDERQHTTSRFSQSD